MGYLLVIAGFIGVPVCLVILIIQAIRKKKLKAISLTMAGLFVCFVVGVIIIAPSIPLEIRDESYYAEQRLEEKQREVEQSEKEVERKAEQERIKAEEKAEQDRVKAEEEASRVESERIEAERIEAERIEAERIEAERLAVTFDEIYKAYKENELRADEKYQYNRYQITAKINGMSTGGLFNLTGGATLTMEKRVGNTIVFFYAEFEKDQEEALKKVNVGDTITYDGECLSAGSWVECEIVE